jgi:putative spermidine/putrescine transport system substrate-binding protein
VSNKILIRTLRVTAAALIAAAAWFGVSATAHAADDNVAVFAGWGGSWQKGERTFYFDSFEKATGIKVIDVAEVKLTKTKTMVDANNVEWDVVQALGMWVSQKTSSGELWEQLDYSGIATDGVPKDLIDSHAVGIATFAQILAYNTNAYPQGKQPTSWADFWDLKKFLGKRGTLNQPRYSLEMALMAKAVLMDKLYPLNVDGSLKKWDAIKSDTLFLAQWPQAPSLLASGEITMTLSSQARILSLRQTKKDAPLALVGKRAS